MHRTTTHLAVCFSLAACARATDNSVWHTETEYWHARNSGTVYKSKVTNTTSDTRSLAIRCRRCDAYRPHMTITNDRGETLFDGVTCDWLRYEVPGNRWLTIELWGNTVDFDLTQG